VYLLFNALLHFLSHTTHTTYVHALTSCTIHKCAHTQYTHTNTHKHYIHYPDTHIRTRTAYTHAQHMHTHSIRIRTTRTHYTTLHYTLTILDYTQIIHTSTDCSHQFGLGQMTREAVDEHVKRQLHGHLTYFLPGGGSAIGCNDRNHFTEKHIHRLDLEGNVIHDTLSPRGQLAHLWFC